MHWAAFHALQAVRHGASLLHRFGGLALRAESALPVRSMAERRA